MVRDLPPKLRSIITPLLVFLPAKVSLEKVRPTLAFVDRETGKNIGLPMWNKETRINQIMPSLRYASSALCTSVFCPNYTTFVYN